MRRNLIYARIPSLPIQLCHYPSFHSFGVIGVDTGDQGHNSRQENLWVTYNVDTNIFTFKLDNCHNSWFQTRGISQFRTCDMHVRGFGRNLINPIDVIIKYQLSIMYNVIQGMCYESRGQIS